MKRRTILKRIGTATAVAAAGAGTAAADHDAIEVGGVGAQYEKPDGCTAGTCAECLDSMVCEDCSDYC